MTDSRRFQIPHEVAALLRHLHPVLKRKVRAGLEAIGTDPAIGKELRGELAGLRSLRVGRHRIVSRLGPRDVIEVVAVGPRRFIYTETTRLLRKGR